MASTQQRHLSPVNPVSRPCSIPVDADLSGIPLPSALVLCLPALLKQRCLIKGHTAASGAGGQEALGLCILALEVLPPQFRVCEESQKRVGPGWASPGAGRLWVGWAGKGVREPN